MTKCQSFGSWTGFTINHCVQQYFPLHTATQTLSIKYPKCHKVNNSSLMLTKNQQLKIHRTLQNPAGTHHKNWTRWHPMQTPERREFRRKKEKRKTHRVTRNRELEKVLEVQSSHPTWKLDNSWKNISATC